MHAYVNWWEIWPHKWSNQTHKFQYSAQEKAIHSQFNACDHQVRNELYHMYLKVYEEMS